MIPLYIALCSSVFAIDVGDVPSMRAFGVFVGTNRGYAAEAMLAYAESDALRLREALQTLGGFRAEDSVVLTGGSSDEMRRALENVNTRVRDAVSHGVKTMLFVYYSGHGDSASLHLGPTPLALGELRDLVSGSPAHFRVLVVDACRSGGVTGVKGAAAAPEFKVDLEDHLPGEGFAVITSSAASEASQESARWGGSLFTSSFLAGLYGAADSSGDGVVTLHEAYAYAYEQTLYATRQTLVGPQHPTFEYALRGKGSMPLTKPGTLNNRLGAVHLGVPGSYYFLDTDTEHIVSEVRFATGKRHVQLPQGWYRVERHARDHLLVGDVRVKAGAATDVYPARLRRVAYAQAIRKGGLEEHAIAAWEVGAGWHGRGGLVTAVPAGMGPMVNVGAHLKHLTLNVQFETATTTRRGILQGSVDQYVVVGAVQCPWDLGPLGLFAGVEGGATIWRETFAPSPRNTPQRIGAAPILGIRAGITAPVWGPVSVQLQGGVRAQLMREQEQLAGPRPAFQVPIVPYIALLATWQGLATP